MIRKYFHQLASDQVAGARAGIMKAIFLLLSYLFGVVVYVRSWLYQFHILDMYRLSKPVISVGNITFGGVGKTPLTVWIAKYVLSKGKKPAILTRGYKTGKSRQSDEVDMIQEMLPGVPVIVGKDRFRAAKKFLKESDVDIFIMDDGFQHRKLRRDLDIVMVDALNPFGNGFLIPRGILREPVDFMSRASLILLTRTDVANKRLLALYDELETRCPRKPVVETIHLFKGLKDIKSGIYRDPAYLKGQVVVLASSIGSPKAFEETLSYCYAEVARHFRYLDHHNYSSEDCKEIAQFCRDKQINAPKGDAKILVTTQKDAVKLKAFLNLLDGIEVLVLEVEMDITKRKEVLVEGIDRLLQR